MNVAKAIDSIPVVASTTERNTLFAVPAMDQRVYNKATGCCERWNGIIWAIDFATNGDAAKFNVKAAPYFAAGDGVADDTAAITAAHTAANLAGGTLVIPPGSYLSSLALAPAAGVRISGYGATYLYSGAGNALQLGVNYGSAEGLKLQKSGAPGTSVGLAVGTAALTGHHSSVRDLQITGFNDGVVCQLSFYCTFSGVDSFGNIARNWRFTNTAISNDLFNCRGRGVGVSLVGIQLDDTTTNVSDIRLFGGTFEGNLVQQMDIIGADLVSVFGGHYETNAPTALTGVVTMTNGSTAVSGAGTLFTTELKVGQYVRLNADGNQFAARVQSITDNLNLVLSATYRGTGGAGAATGSAGLFRITSGVGSSLKCAFFNPELGTASGGPPAYFIQNASDVLIRGTDINMPVILGSAAVRTRVEATIITGGIDDQDTTSQVSGISSSWAAPITGCTTAPTATFKYARNGDMATIWIQQLTATSNSTACTLTGLPAIITPKANNQTLLAPIFDNGVVAVGAAVVRTDGTISLSKGIGGAGNDFTAAGAKGISPVVLTYKII